MQGLASVDDMDLPTLDMGSVRFAAIGIGVPVPIDDGAPSS